MAMDRAGRMCSQTGLSVPECSCKRCLELMLREFSPDLLAAEIKITHQGPRRRNDPGEREAA